MTTLTAPTPGTTAPGPSARSVPTDRVVDRALPAAVVVQLAVVVAGLIVVAAGGAPLTSGTVLAAGVLAGDAARQLLRPRGRAAEVGERTPGLLLPVLAVVGSGAWASPFGAVLAVDLALVGLARGYRRAFTAAGLVAVACLAGGIVAGVPLVRPDGATPLPLLLLLGAALGGYAHGLAAGEHHPDLGHTVHLADANRLVADLHDTLRTLPTAPDAGTVARTAFSWLGQQVPFTAGALLVHDGAGASVVHSEGVTIDDAEAGVLLDRAPATATVADRGGIGLTAAGRAMAWLPLSLRGRDLGLLVLEHDAPFAADARDLLVALGGPLSLALDTARWFARLSTLAGELERSRLAGDLADRLCQSMATTVFTLDRAAVRTGDTELFHLADAVRTDVSDLRRTLDDLRASVVSDGDLVGVVDACVDRAGQRAGFLTTLEVDAPERPSAVVEQQVLRVLQELLAAVDDATAVTVRWTSRADGLVLTVSCDGRLEPPSSVTDRADAIGAALTCSAEPGGAVLTLSTEVQT